jgi:pyruvyltransferase
MKKILSFLFYNIQRLFQKTVPVIYFKDIANVGDALNVDLIEFLSGKTVVCPPGVSKFKHLLAVGSVLDSMNCNTTVWGSGLINEESLTKVKTLGNIRAVRGKLTQKALEERFQMKFDVPLGDPALLLPLLYKKSEVKKYSFGLILHYADKSHPIAALVNSMGGRLIDVSLSPTDFIKTLTTCNTILSSAMHGLILSDAYGIPNKWIQLSDKVLGAGYKFADYYSTTDNPDEVAFDVSETVTEVLLKAMISNASVKNYIFDKNHLAESFPSDIF